MRMMQRQRGDTLIEVLVAVTALSLVVTVCYTVMTRGFAQGQIALERTTTQGMVSGQIAILRDIFARHQQASAQNGAQPEEWLAILSSYMPSTAIATTNTNDGLRPVREACRVATASQPFYFNAASIATTGVDRPTMPKALTNRSDPVRKGSSPAYNDGLWIEGYKVDTSSDDAKPYYIFFVKACWDAAISGERQSMVTNVRFYEAYD